MKYDELQDGKTQSKEFESSVPDDVFDDDKSSTWSEMAPTESVVDNDSADQNVITFESLPEIFKLTDMKSFPDIHNYINSVKYNTEALRLLKEYLDYDEVSLISNSSNRNVLQIVRSMILNSLSKDDSIIIEKLEIFNEVFDLSLLEEGFKASFETSLQIYKYLLSKKLKII